MRRRTRWWAIGAACALVVACVAWAFAQVDHDRAATRHATALVERHTAGVRRELRRARVERARLDRLLARTRAQLSATWTTHDEVGARLRATAALLESVQRTTWSSVLEAEARKRQLEALGTCLDGVNAALNQLSVGDSAGWQQTMRTVATACTTAQTEIPA